jgi:hypothetical protein
MAEERDAAARKEHARREEEERAQAEAASRPALLPARVRVWGAEGAIAAVGLLLAWLIAVGLYRGPEEARAEERSARERGRVAVGDSAASAPLTTLATGPRSASVSRVGLPMPAKPFAGQRTPPCNRYGEVEIRGGCWYRLGDAPAPCREDAYDWKGACYLPSFPPRRPPATDPP